MRYKQIQAQYPDGHIESHTRPEWAEITGIPLTLITSRLYHYKNRQDITNAMCVGIEDFPFAKPKGLKRDVVHELTDMDKFLRRRLCSAHPVSRQP